jgi:hypothetical protein
MDSIVNPVADAVDIIVVHTMTEEDVGESSGYNCSEINHGEEAKQRSDRSHTK